jgi:hypothetical protein
LESRKKAFLVSQPVDIPQNRQRNLWKNLEKQAENLEKFARKLGKIWSFG